MEAKTVDVIVPTYKPAAAFEQLLAGLAEQCYPIHRLILLNTEEAYWTEQVKACLERYQKQENSAFAERVELHHIQAGEFDHGATRDFGVRCSEADYVLLMTDDAIPADTHLVERLVQALNAEADVAEAYARQLAGSTSTAEEGFARQFNYPPVSCTKRLADLPLRGIKTFFASNACCMYKRDVYEQLGGFIRRTIFNEDMIYAYKALQNGYAIRYEADAQVLHAHNYNCLQLLRRNFDMGVSQADHPEVFGAVSSEGEGIRLVKQNVKQLIRQRQYSRLPGLVLKSGCKYLGYRLGKAYRKLPRRLVLALSMNRNYWKEEENL